MITYSTIIKGYVQENLVEEAFEVMEHMKKCADTELRPDEITWNTLLDGCARKHLWERGLSVLQEMQDCGVKPTNYTLSVLAKLCTHCKRYDQAHDLCQEISLKYNFKYNMHVYNNLVQACTWARDLPRAFEVFAKMLSEKVRPDVRTYTLLLRGSLQAGCGQDAAGLLRAALGMRGAHSRIAHFQASLLQLHGGLPGELITEVLAGIANQCGGDLLAVALLREIKEVPGNKISPKLNIQAILGAR
mmetsp:Transcript_132911/g.284083  ORF Transcript_132911/g.284083 Transcript_132911/m.284083 type:complete len:246 (-) Transcript_132911:118-855(-)